MLGNTPIIAFVPTLDFDKARAFYVDVLGLRFVDNDGFAMVLDANGITIRVVKVEFTPWPWTILGWEVPDIAAAANTLREHGVKFESYGFPGQDKSGIWTAPSGDKVAWFKDPDGNTLSISQHVAD